FAQRLARLFLRVEGSIGPHADHGELLSGARDASGANAFHFSSGLLIRAGAHGSGQGSGGGAEEDLASRPVHAVSRASSLRASVITRGEGNAASATKATTVSTGRTARPARSPARRRKRPVTNPWMRSVRTFTTRSMRAKSAVRTRGSVLTRETICACSR